MFEGLCPMFRILGLDDRKALVRQQSQSSALKNHPSQNPQRISASRTPLVLVLLDCA